eukprot:958485-Amphidinium_carterae.2
MARIAWLQKPSEAIKLEKNSHGALPKRAFCHAVSTCRKCPKQQMEGQFELCGLTRGCPLRGGHGCSPRKNASPSASPFKAFRLQLHQITEMRDDARNRSELRLTEETDTLTSESPHLSLPLHSPEWNARRGTDRLVHQTSSERLPRKEESWSEAPLINRLQEYACYIALLPHSKCKSEKHHSSETSVHFAEFHDCSMDEVAPPITFSWCAGCAVVSMSTVEELRSVVVLEAAGDAIVLDTGHELSRLSNEHSRTEASLVPCFHMPKSPL